jgi:general secretion pathway protein L
LSTLYIRLPSKAVAGNAQQLAAQVCTFALASNAGTIEREGAAQLSSLAETIARAQRVVVLLAGSDVTLLRMQTPPLSAATLKAALPNLVEEHLLCDPAECLIVSAGLSEGLRTIAVVNRDWIDMLIGTLIAFGARHIAALPSQLCLSGQAGTVTAAISEHDSCIDMTLHLSELDGIGLTISAESKQTAAHEVIRTLSAVVPEGTVTIYVPQDSLQTYQESLAANPEQKQRFSISADNWTHWIAEARGAKLDLTAGIGSNAGSGFDWRSWRWPLVLGSAVLLINVAALNIEWWHMKSEGNSLRSAMIQIYKSAYPHESVIIDPLAQMQQKITLARRDSGMAVADDFTAITAAFGEAWSGVKATLASPPSIAGLEYREHSLMVRFKPGIDAPTRQMKAALSERGLLLELTPGQSAVIWQVRGTK